MKSLFPLLFSSSLLFWGCVPKQDGFTRIQYSFWGSLEQQGVEREIVQAFEAENPGIKVDLLPVGGTRYAEKIQAMMVGKVAPDVIMVEMSQYAEWAARGALLDLSADVEEEVETLMPVPAAAFRVNGRYYAFPANCSGQAMYFNRDALRRAGVDPAELRTWEDLMRVAPRLASRGGNKEAPCDYAFLMPVPVIVLWGYGVELFDSDRRPSRVTVRSEQAARALDMLRLMRRSGWTVPPDVTNDQGTYQLFRDGKAALHFDGRWRTPDFKGLTDFDWDVLPMPSGPAVQVTQHGGTGLAVSRDSRHAEAARRFVRFYASRDGIRHAVDGGRCTPVYRDMAFGEYLALRPPENIRVFAETMEAGASRFPFYGPGASEVMSILGSRMEQALTSPGVPVDEVLQGLEVDLERWLQRQKRKGLL